MEQGWQWSSTGFSWEIDAPDSSRGCTTATRPRPRRPASRCRRRTSTTPRGAASPTWRGRRRTWRSSTAATRARCEDWAVGGTSCAAPIWAGVLSLLNGERLRAGASSLGFVNPLLYSLAASDATSGAFKDVTEGHNSGCRSTGFYAAKGWDPVTGLGVPNFPLLSNGSLAAALRASDARNAARRRRRRRRVRAEAARATTAMATTRSRPTRHLLGGGGYEKLNADGSANLSWTDFVAYDCTNQRAHAQGDEDQHDDHLPQLVRRGRPARGQHPAVLRPLRATSSRREPAARAPYTRTVVHPRDARDQGGHGAVRGWHVRPGRSAGAPLPLRLDRYHRSGGEDLGRRRKRAYTYTQLKAEPLRVALRGTATDNSACLDMSTRAHAAAPPRRLAQPADAAGFDPLQTRSTTRRRSPRRAGPSRPRGCAGTRRPPRASTASAGPTSSTLDHTSIPANTLFSRPGAAARAAPPGRPQGGCRVRPAQEFRRADGVPRLRGPRGPARLWRLLGVWSSGPSTTVNTSPTSPTSNSRHMATGVRVRPEWLWRWLRRQHAPLPPDS